MMQVVLDAAVLGSAFPGIAVPPLAATLGPMTAPTLPVFGYVVLPRRAWLFEKSGLFSRPPISALFLLHSCAFFLGATRLDFKNHSLSASWFPHIAYAISSKRLTNSATANILSPIISKESFTYLAERGKLYLVGSPCDRATVVMSGSKTSSL